MRENGLWSVPSEKRTILYFSSPFFIQNEAVSAPFDALSNFIFPEEKKERIWINQHELIGSFKILPEEVSENDIADESIPDDLREFFELNAGIINERIRIAVEKKNNYAYFSFSNNESEDLKKRIVTKLEQTIDGAMFSLCDNQLEMNVQNLLDD